MKKLIATLLALCLVFCLAACTIPVTETPNSNVPAQDSFDFTYNGVKIALNAPADAVIAALGEPKSYEASASCAFEGEDKTYGYSSFFIQTYTKGGVDYIYSFWFVDDLVSTNEGLSVLDSLADVQACYSDEYYNGTDTYAIRKGSGMMTIILENEIVTAIQYVIVTD